MYGLRWFCFVLLILLFYTAFLLIRHMNFPWMKNVHFYILGLAIYGPKECHPNSLKVLKGGPKASYLEFINTIMI